jgi:ribose transport system substrate-binding protein
MRYRTIVWLSALALLSLGLVACGDDDDSGDSTGGGDSAAKEWPGASIDVGTHKIEVEEGTGPKIAFFSSTGNTYEDALNASVEETAEELGADVTMFDAKLTPTTQFNQAQNALQSGEYNAWIVQTMDPNQMCKIMTEQAPEADIVVVGVSNPLCGREVEPWGEETSYSPGMWAQVNSVFTVTYDMSWVDAAVEFDDPKGKTYALITGPPLFPSSIVADQAMEEHPEVDLAATIRSNYTAADSFAKVQNLLQANPDLDGIYSVYSEMTRGAVQAIKAAGLEDQIKVFDLGGSEYSVEAIRNGEVSLTIPYGPVQEGEQAVESIVQAFEGKAPQRLWDALPKGTPEEPYVITEANADSFKPDY